MRLILTAGFDRALHVVATAELLARRGHEVAHVLVASPFSVRRLRSLVRRRGKRSLFEAARRIAGLQADDVVAEWLAELGIEERSIAAWCARRGVTCTTVKSLDAAESLAVVGDARVEGVLYGGGGILSERFLAACRGRVLNAHSGPLPAVRGMNACEWSLLLGREPVVTIHVIERGIDTGATITEIPVAVESGDTIDAVRARCTIRGVEGLVDAVGILRGPLPSPHAVAPSSRQCFVLAPALRELLESDLARERPERST